MADWKVNPAWLSVPEHMKLQYCYEDSPICVPDGTPALGRRSAALRALDPARHARAACLARRRRSTLDLFGDGFVLLRLGADPPDATPLIDAAKARGVPLREVALADPDVAALYETPAGAGAAGRPCRLARRRMPGRTPARSSIASAAPCRRRAMPNRRPAARPEARTQRRAFAIVAESALENRHERNRHAARPRPATVPTRTSARTGRPRTCGRCGRTRSPTRSARAGRRRTTGNGSWCGRWSTTP